MGLRADFGQNMNKLTFGMKKLRESSDIRYITEDGDSIKKNVIRKLWRKEYTDQHDEQNGNMKI